MYIKKMKPFDVETVIKRDKYVSELEWSEYAGEYLTRLVTSKRLPSINPYVAQRWYANQSAWVDFSFNSLVYWHFAFGAFILWHSQRFYLSWVEIAEFTNNSGDFFFTNGNINSKAFLEQIKRTRERNGKV